MITAPRVAMLSVRPIAQWDGPCAPAPEALGHMPGQGRGAERGRQCPGGTAAPSSWSPPPGGARAGLRPLQRRLSVSIASCGRELGAAGPLLAGAAFQHREISGDGGPGCFNSSF